MLLESLKDAAAVLVGNIIQSALVLPLKKRQMVSLKREETPPMLVMLDEEISLLIKIHTLH
jgi:predicted ATP-grasp superfamily ATP-dependent carboligase